jgi:hypothetical protein
MGIHVPFIELGDELLMVFVGEQLPSSNSKESVMQIRILLYFMVYNYRLLACLAKDGIFFSLVKGVNNNYQKLAASCFLVCF